MSVTLDFSADYRVWGSPEAVTLKSVRPNSADAEYPVTIAIRLPLTTKERQASNGVYTGQDVRWVLPKPLINDGSTAPKPRDTIRDAAGTDWTILDVSFGRLRQSYQCISRDLVLHADLRDRVNIVRAVITQDAAKGLIRTWTTGPYLNVPARVQPIESMSVDERGKRGFRTAYDVIVGRQMDITDEDRVQWTKNDGSSVTLQILGVRNPERIDELMVIRAEVVP